MDQPTPELWPDRVQGMLSRNPWELVLMTWWVFGGLILAASAFTRWAPSPSLLKLPDWMALLMGLPITAGGVLVLVAMFRRFENLAAKWRIERAGLCMGAVGLGLYAVAVLLYRPTSVMPAGMALAIVAAALVRVRASTLHERAVRAHREEKRCVVDPA